MGFVLDRKKCVNYREQTFVNKSKDSMEKRLRIFQAGTFADEAIQIFLSARTGPITSLQLFNNTVRCDFHCTSLKIGAGHPQGSFTKTAGGAELSK